MTGLVFAAFFQLGVPLRASYSARVNVDEPFYLLTTVSLIEDGDLDLTNDYALARYRAFFDHPEDLWYQSVPTPDGRLLSPHNVGTSILILPAYRIGGVDGVKRFLATLGGLLIALTLLIAYRVSGHLPASLAAAAAVGVSAPVFVYATQIYPEAPAALLVCLAVYLLIGRPGPPAAIGIALALTGLVWLGTKYGLVGSAIGLAALIRLDRRARLLFLGLIVPNALVYAAFHRAVYGGLTPYSVNLVYAGSSTTELVGLHFELWNRLYRLIGLWTDGEFGAARWAPALAIALPGLPCLIRRPGPARWTVPAVILIQVGVAAFFSISMRGWWFPGRMLVVALPLLAVPTALWLAAVWRSRAARAIAAILGLYTLGITWALQAAAEAGQVALAVDPFTLPWAPFRVVAALFPVYTSYEPATWALTALWTLIAVALVAAGWWSTRQGGTPGACSPRVKGPLPVGAGRPDPALTALGGARPPAGRTS